MSNIKYSEKFGFHILTYIWVFIHFNCDYRIYVYSLVLCNCGLFTLSLFKQLLKFIFLFVWINKTENRLLVWCSWIFELRQRNSKNTHKHTKLFWKKSAKSCFLHLVHCETCLLISKKCYTTCMNTNVVYLIYTKTSSEKKKKLQEE